MISIIWHRTFHNRIFFSMAFFFMAFNGSRAEETIISCPEIEDIAGPVQSVTFEEMWFNSQDGERISCDRYLSSVCFFTPSGVLKERVFYYGEEKPTARWIREFDDQGHVIQEAKYKGDNQLITKVQYRHDEADLRTDTLVYRFDGTLDKLFEHRYDSKDQLIETVEHRQEVVRRKTVYTYDEQGHRTSYSCYNPDDVLEMLENFYYDRSGNLVQSSISNQESIIATMTYFLDEQGRNTELLSHSQGGRIDMRRLYQYDERGNVTDLTSFGRDGKFIDREVYSYEYDDRGNWIVKQESTARLDTNTQVPVRIIFREISYFDEKSGF